MRELILVNIRVKALLRILVLLKILTSRIEPVMVHGSFVRWVTVATETNLTGHSIP